MTRRISGISSMATRQILVELVKIYRQRTGCEADFRSMGGVEAARLVRDGAQTDIVLLASNVMDQLESEGHILSGSCKAFASSGIAVAIPAGATRPDISDEHALRRATLEAGRICYSTGPSGQHLRNLWDRWGLSDIMSERSILAPPGVPVAEILARGEADLGFQQLSELLNVDGIEIVGPLPVGIQATTIFTAGIASVSSQRDEARALIDFLVSPDAESAKRRHGMSPA